MIFDQNATSLYGNSTPYFGLGFGWTELSGPAAAIVVVIKMICAGISIVPRVGGTPDMTPRLSGTPEVEEC